MDVQYKMIGGDGREYGPASFDEIKQWIREGRIGAATMIWRSDSQTWMPAARLSEFEADFGIPKAPPIAPVVVGFMPRATAYGIDQIILTIIVYTIWGIFFAHKPGWQVPSIDLFNPDPSMDLTQLLTVMKAFGNKILILYLPTILIYEVAMNGAFGATFGKMIMGMRIVRMDNSRINYDTALLRWIGERFSEMFLFYAGHLFVAFRSDKRALHDLIARTHVIYKR